NEILKTYFVNAKLRFSDCLRRFINRALDVHRRINQIKVTMADQADNEIKACCKREVWEHAHRLKEVITGRVDAIPS
ncbi:hypothetical protein GGI06_004398, partial [Coemansia sp. S85]